MTNKLEKFWRRHHSFLHEHGYELRDKFKPGWVPTWKNASQRARDPNGPTVPVMFLEPFPLTLADD
ncbi:hypothetical protein CPB85DRAFT_1277724 [Mucidula mucida]|nr:hypothetical protein CPB85DRAFT_1277724 [Mucidula mucida]